MTEDPHQFYELQAHRVQTVFLTVLTFWLVIILFFGYRLYSTPLARIREGDSPSKSQDSPYKTALERLLLEKLPAFGANVTGIIYWTYDFGFTKRTFKAQGSVLYTEAVIETIRIRDTDEYGYAQALAAHKQGHCFTLLTADMMPGTALQVATTKAGLKGFTACPVFDLNYYLQGGKPEDYLVGYVSVAWNQPKETSKIQSLQPLLKEVAISVSKLNQDYK